MKNVKIRKKYFSIFFALNSGPTKSMASVNFFFKISFFLLLRSSVLQVFGWIWLDVPPLGAFSLVQ